MPRDSTFAVLEIGMNNPGEIAALTKLVRPHVAVVTAVASAHIENLGSIEAIADAKGEIFAGLEDGGIAIIPEDSRHRDRLVRAARDHAERVVTFGLSQDADVTALHAVRSEDGGFLITARLLESELTYSLSQRGEHWVTNSLAVLAAVEAVGGDLAAAGLALADLSGLKGRGERHRIALEDGEALLIDESYNANPASMAATLQSLGSEEAKRRIAVLGPMRELGEHADQLHADLAAPVLDAKVDRLILIGDDMAPLAKALGKQVAIDRAASVEDATDLLLSILRPGDAVLVKASNSVGLARLVETVTESAVTCST
jgi:UDP-N-acetylmuramoyl-tripeptide--D-alanyl-D-alanine ligase